MHEHFSALWQPQSPLMAGHTSLTFPLFFISSSLSFISLDIDIIINKGEGVGLRRQEKQQKRKFLKDLFLFLRGCVGVGSHGLRRNHPEMQRLRQDRLSG